MMHNLAGCTISDVFVSYELRQAGIQRVQGDKPRGEPQASVTGILTFDGEQAFSFERAWYYWMVSGPVPLAVAEEMYADPIGFRDVRVAGYAGNDLPSNWAFPRGPGLGDYAEKHPRVSLTYGKIAELCNTGVITDPRFVDSYHIDSQAGLNIFTAVLAKHGLIDILYPAAPRVLPLKRGGEIAEDKLIQILTQLDLLVRWDGYPGSDAAIELVRAIRQENFENLSSETCTSLRGRKLIEEGRIPSEEIRQVVSSAVEVNGDRAVLVNPIK